MTHTITSLASLTPDSQNANKGTERGLELIRASLEKFGAGRSIVLDKDGRIVAGNQTARAAVLAGMDDVIIVRTDGRQIVAVQRTDIDLDSPEGRELALIDNRASEVGLSWDSDVLADLQGDGLDLSGLFTAGEMEALLSGLARESDHSSIGVSELSPSVQAALGSPAGPRTETPAVATPKQDAQPPLHTSVIDASPTRKTEQASAPSAKHPAPPVLPDNSRYREQYGVIVICSSEDHQRSVYEDLRGQGHTCKVVVT